MKSYMSRNEAHYVCSGRRQSAAFCGNFRHYDKDRLEEIVMQEVKETILDAGYLEEYYQQCLEEMKKEEAESARNIRLLQAAGLGRTN